MKHRMIMALIALLIPMFSQAQTTATINPNDSLRYVMQLRSDSMRYAAEVKIEELKIQAYKDSIVYSKMSKEDLYVLERAKVSRYYKTIEEELLQPQLIIMVTLFICTLAVIYMVISARERGRRRSHEYRMAQLERGGLEKPDGLAEEDLLDIDNKTAKIKINQAVYEDAPSSPFGVPIKDYLAVNTKYRRYGVLFIIAGIAVMSLFWADTGFSSPWMLGLIPAFIGVAFLYLDYVSMSDKKRKLKAYQDYLSQEEKEQNSTTASTQCKEE
ncbi:MAG: hypothetical protein IKT29_04025 [Flavobacteriales bacterium]|nr:hypothetical protein [Flavobacteriales bacterium]